ncbi:MAG TPA: hypothetical protein P5318_09315 [Candidatus Hydrogenedentes bacterium]|nr:hypothetical protein [Candidatus Hydrogenedentota bacterium]HRT20313.1 hypothetical protein [Candidatus Hydrogenedentota bacterium]HRT65038.1 hypothetical protein [Candidatus Hydrogenedentota bacterium]
MRWAKWKIVLGALLWAPVVALLLEAAVVAGDRWVQRFNPYILLRDGRPLSRLNPYVLANGNNLSKFLPNNRAQPALKKSASSIGWEDWNNQRPIAADWEIPVKNESLEQKERRRSHFLQLNHEERMSFARTQSETVLKYSASGMLETVYDDLLVTLRVRKSLPVVSPIRLDDLAALANRALRDGAPVSASLATVPPARPYAVEMYGLPDRDKKSAYVFAPLRLLYTDADLCVPETSMYETYQVRYKRGLRGSRPGEYPEQHFETNRYGFRAPDVAVPKPVGTFRILCIGGSTTVEGPSNDLTYPAILEGELRGRFPGKAIEVLNCGIEGIGTSNHFLLLPDYLELQPDLVIAYEGVNDVGRDLQFVGELEKPHALHIAARSRFVWRFGQRLYRTGEDAMRRKIRDLTIANMEMLRRIFARNGIRFALCSIAHPHFPLPCAQRQYYDRTCNYTSANHCALMDLLNDEIRLFCRDRNLLHIPVYESLENVPPVEYLGDICHMNGKGIRWKAEIVAAALVDYIAPAIEALPPVS